MGTTENPTREEMKNLFNCQLSVSEWPSDLLKALMWSFLEAKKIGLKTESLKEVNWRGRTREDILLGFQGGLVSVEIT